MTPRRRTLRIPAWIGPARRAGADRVRDGLGRRRVPTFARACLASLFPARDEVSAERLILRVDGHLVPPLAGLALRHEGESTRGVPPRSALP